MPLPQVRPLEAYPVLVDGRRLICLRDPEGVVDEPLVVSPKAFAVASMLDGTSEVIDLQAAYARRTGGDLLFSQEIQQVVDDLDRHGFLRTDRFEALRRGLEDAFRASPVRPAYHAGRAYPADPAALTQDLARHLAAVQTDELDGLRPRGVIAPHIDFARGGWCYAWAHAALAAAAPTTVLILGVAHHGPDAPFILTTKPYATPFGAAPVDAELAAFLQRRVDGLLDHETVHRAEHSIEVQVVYLQHVFQQRPVAIVPVLCSGPDREAPGRSPRALPAVEAFVGAVRDAMAAGHRIAIVVSVDFSHVGPRFGDAEPVDQAMATRTSLGDRAALETIARGDAEAWWATVMGSGNPTRIDAAFATYVALRILEPCAGRLLRYGQAPDPAGGLVTFASIALV
ncbi:MAG: AmmeMemoRadiSam system protein B [Armatimonadota bacterium]|nr:AmmeMemoRadiSam system protein B [Armatimonadota bacterium]